MRPLAAAIPRLARTAGGALLNMLLPPHCPGCDTLVPRQGNFCQACFTSLIFITNPLCHSCGLPFASLAAAGKNQRCPTCIERPPAWSQARSAFLYNDAAASLILPFKHAGREDLAYPLAAQMARAGQTLLAGAHLLVPVPLHRTRLRQRGFNQSARLAEQLSRRSQKPTLVDALQRIRPTASLGQLNAAARAAELADAILVRDTRAGALYGRHILLIDDVMTSGATATSCTRALLAAGAASVDVLVGARVPDPRTH